MNWMPFVDGLVVYLDADGDDLDEMAYAIQQANIIGIDIEYRELPTMRSTPTRWQRIADAFRVSLP